MRNNLSKPLSFIQELPKTTSYSYFCRMFKKWSAAVLLFALVSCGKEVMPKPAGELRLEYPAAKYETFDACTFTFEKSAFSNITDGKKPCWYYLNYPEMKAKVFITYFPIRNDLSGHVKESEKMVYEHTKKASSIDTKSFEYPEKKVYGNFYEMKGQSASNLQFFVTDSTRHFVTAYLYFNTRPKPDSLAPAVEYVKKDMMHLIETLEWK